MPGTEHIHRVKVSNGPLQPEPFFVARVSIARWNLKEAKEDRLDLAKPHTQTEAEAQTTNRN